MTEDTLTANIAALQDAKKYQEVEMGVKLGPDLFQHRPIKDMVATKATSENKRCRT